jgi:hypothetical protein
MDRLPVEILHLVYGLVRCRVSFSWKSMLINLLGEGHLS